MRNKNTNIRSNLKQLMPFLRPYRFSFVFAIIFIIASTVFMSIAPKVEGMITTQLAKDASDILKGVSGAGVDFTYIIHILIVCGSVYLCKTLSQIVSVFLLTNAIQNTMHDLRNALEHKIHKLPVSYFDTNQFGDVLSRITNDIDAVSNALQQSFSQVISAVLSVCLAVGMMFSINFWMTIITLLIIPCGLLITKVIVGISQKHFKAQQDALGVLNGNITEMYTGFNEIMLYNRQDEMIERFRSSNDKLRESAFKAQFISSTMSPSISLVTYLGIGGVAVLGTLNAINGTLAVGNLQAFIRYIWQINDPISQVSQLSSAIQSAFAAMSRVFAILNEPEEVKEAEPAAIIPEVKGNVSFENVKFGYHPDKTIISNLNAEVKRGQMVVIVGPTGAGKTTLINLLLRFYDVNSGSIKIDGIDIRDMKRDDLRAMFGMVLQDTWLFSGTIFENIRYGRLNARKDEVIEAAKTANVHHFIRTLSDGYDMFINEEGNNISQGEKQLLTIARAILKNPQILILDEATSSVDTRLELMLQTAMKNVMKGRTSFVIAHRLSTIRSADLILVINNGDIMESGTHEELLAKKGFYEQLYNSQFASCADEIESDS